MWEGLGTPARPAPPEAQGPGRPHGVSSVLAGAAMVVVLLATASPAVAHDFDPGFGAHGGVVFRRDEFDVPTLRHTRDYFASLYTFRHPLGWKEQWVRGGSDYRLIAGSITNDDLYMEQDGRIEASGFDDRFRVRYRFVQDEDFDSRYTRNLLSAEVDVGGGFYVGASGELHARKADIDVGVLAGWRGRRLEARFDVILPDAFFGTKSTGGDEYDRHPVSFIGRVKARPTPEFEMRLHGEFMTPAEIHFADRNLDGRMTKARVGGGFYWQRGRRAVGLDFIWERTTKRTTDLVDPMSVQVYDLKRHALLADLRATAPLGRSCWNLDVGLHGVFLDELIHGPAVTLAAPEDQPGERRREIYASVGVTGSPAIFGWRPGLVTFSPMLLGGWLDVERKGFRVAHEMLRLAPRVIIAPSRKLRIVLNPTFRLDQPRFGGGNAQVVIDL